MRIALRFLLVLVFLSAGFEEVSQAGQFEIEDFWYTTWLIDTRGFFVGVNANAEYKGSKDASDKRWSINTKLDFVPGPFISGRGKSGTQIPYTGYTVWCTINNGCAASGDVVRPNCPARIAYTGEAIVIIWHTGKEEEDYRRLPTYLVPCHRCPPDDEPGPPAY